ncbi:hypothetical protein AAEY27_20480 [Kosakonia sp. BYX6]|uniref:HEAT repeat domain-containing protein n=1 Tax=Kosakonia calanthes TaxID=3139408 RepID=A0ABZ3B456_9ENTR
MADNQKIIQEYNSLNEEGKFNFLRNFTQPLDRELAKFMLAIATDINGDDDARIEAVKILGLYRGDYDDEFIKKELIIIINNDDFEDDSLIVNCINTLALLSMTDEIIEFALNIIQSDSYILFKGAAFSLLSHNKQHPKAIEALKSLLNDKDYGKSAKRELE